MAGKRIKDLAARAASLLTGSAFFAVDGGSTVDKINYAELARQIVEEYNQSSLAGSAQPIKTALDALNSNTWALGISPNNRITSGQDLNDFLTPGVYDCNSTNIAQTLLNCPVDTGFRLIVSQAGYSSTAYCIQTIINGSGSSIPREFKRSHSGSPSDSVWREWKQTPTRPEMDAVTTAVDAVSFFSETIGTDTVTYNVPQSYRGVLYILDSAINHNGMYTVTSSGSGAVNVKDISAATDIVFNTSTAYKLSVTASNGTRKIAFMDFERHISRVTTS